MFIRQELPGDEGVVRALHRRAFAKPATDDAPAVDGSLEANLVDELRADGDLLAPLCLVAECEGRVVGHVAMSRCRLDDRPAPLAALGPLGVDPDHQASGVGSALMHATIAAADAVGQRGIVLLGHPTYYPRFGFGPAADHGITPPQDWGPAYFMLRRLGSWGDGLSGAFRYAPAFERLDG
ncbi:putative acetyltransferase [Pedococcus dokdonensis]|uniref:Putative acetyltransferase n=1 Tax=Pedococcus dokdonensis TaxID=443156 RepID=A0A1H0V2T5_9MICO|nr:N-acetyltransferase [Pedococcus dokdonensis]SDP72839.1 putative acetyltransferase [Pedococcus dokdonensis]